MTYKTKGELVLEQIKEMILSGKILPCEDAVDLNEIKYRIEIQAVDDHRGLVESIAAGNFKRAKRILTGHKDKIQTLLQKSMSPVC